MRRIQTIFLTAVLVFGLTACAGNAPRGPLTTLRCIDAQEQIVALCDGGEDRVVVQSGTPAADSADGRYLTGFRLRAVNVARDRVTAEGSLRSNDEMLLGVRPDGALVTADENRGIIGIYGADLTWERDIPYEGGALSFDRKGDCLFCVAGGEVRRVALDGGGAEVVFSAPGYGEIAAVDTAHGLALVLDAGVSDATGREFCVYDMESGEPVLWGEDDFYSYQFCGGELAVICGNGRTDSAEESARRVELYDLRTGEKRTAFALAENTLLACDNEVPYAIGIAYTYGTGEDIFPESTRVFLADLKAGSEAETALCPNGAGLVACTSLEGEELSYVFGVTDRTEGELRSRLVLVRPELLAMETALPEAEPLPAADGETLAAGEHLRQPRELADEIEQTYHVRILLGDECLNIYQDPGYSYVSTEDESFSPGQDGEVWELTEALDRLRDTLAAYPAGFFDTFRNGRGAGGLRFAFVRDMVNNFGTFSAGGLEYDRGAWYNIAIDIDMMSDSSTLHHELWHAVESRVLRDDADAFRNSTWNALNPDGFAYGENFDSYLEQDDLYRYELFWGGDAYFVDSYSTVNGQEDRATLIEEIFRDWGDDDAGSSYQWVCSFPHLKEKLDYMARRVESSFGGVYWEEML